MKDPERGRKLDEQGLGAKILVGDAYTSFYREAHEKAKKYTAWAKQRPQK